MSSENPTGEGKIEKPNLTPGELLFSQLNQTRPEEYDSLIKRQENRINESAGTVCVVDYFKDWLNRPERGEEEIWEAEKKVLADRLKNAPLVDLGSGYDTDGYNVAEDFGSSVYIGVDIYPYGAEEKPLNPLVYDKERYEDYRRSDEPECMLVRADMLDFVSRLPDGSVNFMMNGLDCMNGGNEYDKKLAKEILRALKPGGLIFGINIPGAPDEAVWEAKDSLEGYTLDSPIKFTTVPSFFAAWEKVKKS